MNHCVFMGNLVREPELKHLPSGMAVLETGVAVNKTWKDKATGEKKEKVAFIDVTWWGRNAENVAKYFHKGDRILVEGELDQDSWTDKAMGAKRSKLKVQGSRFHFLPRGHRDSTQDAKQALSGEDNQSDPAVSFYQPEATSDSEVPF